MVIPLKSIIVPISLIVFFLSSGCNKREVNKDGTAMQQQLQNILQKNDQQLKKGSKSDSEHIKTIGSLEELNSIVENTPGKLLIFDLYADWCMPCRLLAPIYDTIAQIHGHNATFYRVDVQRQQDVASAFNVRSIPLVVFIKDKEIVHMVPGLGPREHYEQVISSCGADVSVSDCLKNLKKIL